MITNGFQHGRDPLDDWVWNRPSLVLSIVTDQGDGFDDPWPATFNPMRQTLAQALGSPGRWQCHIASGESQAALEPMAGGQLWHR